MTEIRYFRAVCETLNFHRAAGRCHVTQPALSRAIQKLEAELGGQLFCREKGRADLTEFWRLMRPHLREVLLRKDHARTIARGFKSEREDWIMTMVAAGMGICFLPENSDIHPGIRYRLVANPDVVRTVSVVSVADRALPPAARPHRMPGLKIGPTACEARDPAQTKWLWHIKCRRCATVCSPKGSLYSDNPALNNDQVMRASALRAGSAKRISMRR